MRDGVLFANLSGVLYEQKVTDLAPMRIGSGVLA